MNTDKPSNRANLRTYLILLLAMGISGAGYNADVPLVVKITGFYRISDSVFGLLLGLTTMIMAGMSAPWGYWADRHRRVTLLKISVAIIFACMFSAGLCLQFHIPFRAFFLIKLLSGIGFAGVLPVSYSAVMDSAPPKQRGAAFGWISLAYAGGGAMGMLVASGCMQMQIGLGLTYILIAAMEGVLLLTLFFMEEPRRGAQDEALADTVGSGMGEYCHRIEPKDLKELARKPINLLLGAGAIIFNFPPAVLTIWFVTFLIRNHGFTELKATQLMLLSFSGMGIGLVLGGIISDRAYRGKPAGRVWVMIIMAALAPAFLIAALMLPFRLTWFMPLMIAANFFIMGGGPALTTLSLEVNLPEHRGTISALLAIGTSIALGLSWYVPPLIATALGGNYHHVLVLTAAVYLPLIAIYFVMRSRIGQDLDHVEGILLERAKEIQNSPEKTCLEGES